MYKGETQPTTEGWQLKENRCIGDISFEIPAHILK